MQPQSTSHKIKIKHNNSRASNYSEASSYHGDGGLTVPGQTFGGGGSGNGKRDKGKGRSWSVKSESGSEEEDVTGAEGGAGKLSLLSLPHSLLPQILSLIPPRSLLPIRLISPLFLSILSEDSVWRDSYLNRFFASWGTVGGVRGDSGEAINGEAGGREREEEMAKGLVRSCVGDGGGGGGWRKEGLSRESMLDRFVLSKAPTVVHNSHIDIITSLSLFYTPPQESKPPSSMIGKGLKREGSPMAKEGNSSSSTPTEGNISSSAPPSTFTPTASQTAGPSHSTPSTTVTLTNSSSSPSPNAPTPTKLICAKHRQPHNRPSSSGPSGFGGQGGMGRAPNTISVGMNAGMAVRGDPLVGKTLQGWLGPSQIANLGGGAPVPQCSYTPTLNPAFIIWGCRSGHVILNILLNILPHPGRLSGPIVTCNPDDNHSAPVTAVWAPPLHRNQPPEQQRFVSGGEDGRIKIWRMDDNINVKSRRLGPAGTLICEFTSDVIPKAALASNGKGGAPVPRAFAGLPDTVVILRMDAESGVIVAAMESGSIWLLTGFEGEKDQRTPNLQCLLEAVPGHMAPDQLELFVQEEDGSEPPTKMLSILLHIKSQATFDRSDYRLESTGVAQLIEKRTLGTTSNVASLCSFHVEFDLPPSISLPSDLVPNGFAADIAAPPALSKEGVAPAAEVVGRSRSTQPLSQAHGVSFSRFVVAGGQDGTAHVWTWESSPSKTGPKDLNPIVLPVRSWDAGEGYAITAVTSARGLIATGSADGNVKIWDALERNPILLKTVRNRHAMTPSPYPAPDTHESLLYSVNAIILEADMVVASIGPNVVGWRAGNRKTKDGKNGWKGQVLGKHGSGKASPAKGYDAKHLKTVVAESKQELDVEQDQLKAYHRRENQIKSELDSIGFDNSEEAIQYAMMISREESDLHSDHRTYDNEGELDDDPDLADALEAIARAESLSTPASFRSDRSNGSDYMISGGSGSGGFRRSPRIMVQRDMTEEEELALALEQIAAVEAADAKRNGEGSGDFDMSF